MTPEPDPIARLHVATGDADLATERFQRAFPGIRLTPDPEGPRFGFDLRRIGDGRLTVDRLLLSGSADGSGSIADVVAVGRVLEGRLDLEYARRTVDTAAPFLRPGGKGIARMTNPSVELIALDPTLFVTAARALLEGSGRVALLPGAETTAPMTARLGTSWNRIAEMAAGVAFDEAAFASPLIRSGLFELVVSGLLATFPIAVEAGPAGGTGVGSATIRRALAFIDEHLADPLDTIAIADAAGVPVRTLQSGFRDQVGVAPMEHVRLQRLAATHQELLDADPSGPASVADIAHRWGFAHLARFAERYRQVYGEKPSETLRR